MSIKKTIDGIIFEHDLNHEYGVPYELLHGLVNKIVAVFEPRIVQCNTFTIDPEKSGTLELLGEKNRKLQNALDESHRQKRLLNTKLETIQMKLADYQKRFAQEYAADWLP